MSWLVESNRNRKETETNELVKMGLWNARREFCSCLKKEKVYAIRRFFNKAKFMSEIAMIQNSTAISIFMATAISFSKLLNTQQIKHVNIYVKS